LSEVLHPLFLPFSEAELLKHFIKTGDPEEDPLRHLAKWKHRISEAPSKDPSFLQRDETLWTAGALLAIHRSAHPAALWRKVMALLFGPIPPTTERIDWSDLVGERLELFFEVGLPSPISYRRWLSEHLHDRHALETQRIVAASRGTSLEGRTHLDALLLCPKTGFAIHFEAKVLSDIDAKTTHDSLRNQLARNVDCLVNAPSDHPVLHNRHPDRSFLVLLTPEIFRRNWRSRLYGHLMRDYATDPAALQRDLPHLDGFTCSTVSRRLAWLTFEDLRTVEPAACPWLAAPGIASSAGGAPAAS
jgi:hypothetical protein